MRRKRKRGRFPNEKTALGICSGELKERKPVGGKNKEKPEKKSRRCEKCKSLEGIEKKWLIWRNRKNQEEKVRETPKSKKRITGNSLMKTPCHTEEKSQGR